MKRYIAFCFIAIWFASCADNKPAAEIPAIDIEANLFNMEEITLDVLSENIEYICLGYSGYNLTLSMFSSLEFNDSLIMATDLTQCLLYKKNGEFYKKIGERGRGPGEYHSVINARFGPEGTIFLQNLYDLMIYNIDGTFVEKRKDFFRFNEHVIASWSIIRDSLIFGKISSSEGNADYKAVLYNINSYKIVRVYNNYIKFNRSAAVYGFEEEHSNIFEFNDRIYFKEFFNDTLFGMTDDLELTPLYCFNFGKYEWPLSNRQKLPNEWDFSNSAHMPNIYMTERYLLLDCDYGNMFPAKRITPNTLTVPSMDKKSSITVPREFNTHYALGLYDLKSGDLVFSEPTSTDNRLFTSGLYNNIDGGPRFYPNAMIGDTMMVMWAEATDLKYHIASDDFKNAVVKYPEKKQKLLELADSLDELDNPVLILVTLNECNGLKSLGGD